jgi:hypothetical protein
MHLPCLLQNLRASRGLRLGSLALVLTATFTTPAARATTHSPDASATPPAYPDSAHVLNGCRLSTLRFLSRLLSEFPQEQGEPLVITMRNAGGARSAHTIALFSWQGHAWCRDEYYGVFALDCPFEAHSNPDRLVARAEKRLEKHAQMLIRTAQVAPRSEPPAHLSAEQNLRDVTTAARIIPYATTIFWLRCDNREIPVAFFRPAGQEIAVYDPVHGTSSAECSCRDDAKVVSAVAAQLGYRVNGVRPDLTLTQSTLLAASDPAHAAASQ